MLFDPKWAPVEIKLEPWQEILLKAADILEEKGWIQGSLGFDSKGYCAFGAMLTACSAGNFGLDKATEKMSNALNNNSTLHFHDSAIFQWNDGTGQTKENVVSKMREVAHAV